MQAMPTRIALLSDTHGFMGDDILDHCREADEIWHAGDIGAKSVITALERLGKPVRAVHGNIDSNDLQIEFPEDQHFTLEDVRVWMRHIVGNPKRYRPEILERLERIHQRPDLLICGHSHILEIGRDAFGVLFMNPGAAGHHGTHNKRTMVRFTLDRGAVKDVEAIDFGPRGRAVKR
jgi:uncharacterized protein